MTPEAQTKSPAKAGAREWWGLAVLALPTFLLSLDNTVLNVALPYLARDLQPSSTGLLWIVDIYGFAIAGFLVTMGTLGDRIGRRRLLLYGAVGFTVASILCAYSTSAEMLIFARAALGFFGATLMPSTLALISTMFANPKQRTQAIAVWGACFSSGIAVGPPIGGLMLEYFWWGSVFLLAIPVMGILFIAGPILLPEYRSGSSRRLDLVSVVMSLATVLPVIWGIKDLGEDGWRWQPVLAIVIGVVVGVLFVMRQRRLAEPLLDVRLFSSKAFSSTLIILLIGIGTFGGVYLFVTQYLQLVKGLTPLEAGMWFIPPALALLVTAGSSPAFLRWLRPGYLVGIGLCVSGLGYFILLQADASDPTIALVAPLMVIVGGLGPVVALGTDLVLGAAPLEKSGSAAAMSETAMEFGSSLGIAVLGSIGMSVYRAEIADTPIPGAPAEATEAARETLPGAVEVSAELPPEVAASLLDTSFDAFVNGLHFTAVVCGITVVALSLAAFFVVRNVQPRPQTEVDAAESDGATESDGAAASDGAADSDSDPDDDDTVGETATVAAPAAADSSEEGATDPRGSA